MKILKVLAVGSGILLLVLVGALLAVRYFFPAEAVRQQLEEVLSRQLQANARVASLEWDLLNGMRLGPVEIRRNGARLAELDDLALRYDLWHLLHGTLVINEVVLTRAGVFVDLEDRPAQPGAAPRAEPPAPASLPALPLAVDLQSIRIAESEITVKRGAALHLALHRVNLSASLRAGPRNAETSGTLDIADVEVAMGEDRWRLPLHVEFAAAADLPEERVIVERLELRSDPVLRLAVTGRVDHVASSREVALSLDDGEVDLEHLLRLARPLLPPRLSDMRLAGTVSPKVTVEGGLAGGGFDGMVDVELRGTGVHGAIPALQVTLEPTTFQVRAGEIPVRANLPRSVRADLSLTSPGAAVPPASLRNLDLRVGAAHAESGQFSGHLTARAEVSAAVPPATEPFEEAIELDIEASGDATTSSVSLRRVAARIGELLDFEASGAVGAPEGASSERAFAVNAILEADAMKIVPALPRAALRGVALTSRRGRQKLTLDLTGTLDAGFRPRRADASARLDLGGLRASSTQPKAAGTVERVRVSMEAAYRAPAGSLNGTLAGAVALADLAAGTSLSLAAAEVKFRSAISGRASPGLLLRRLVATTRLDVESRRIRYARPGLEGRLERLTVSTAAEADVLGGAYALDALRLSAGELMDLTAKGQFRSKPQRFSVDISVPSFNLGELGRHLSGPAVEALAGLTPAGRVSLRVRGFGAVPRPDQVDALEIPVSVVGTLELRDVAGAFGDHAVAGANGTVRLTVEPEARHRITSSWHVRARRVALGGGLPIEQINGLTADVEVSAEDFDRIAIERIRLGVDGAEVSLDGELSGVKRVLARSHEPPLALLGSLFVKLRSNAEVDLDRFADVLRSFGLAGSGRAGLSLGLLKRERGPLDVRVRLLPRGVSLSKDATRVEDLDGTIDVRKVLGWMPGRDGASPDTAFSPMGVLPELRAATPSPGGLRIRLLDSGGVQVRDLSAGLFFDGSRFVVQDLAMTVLDGGLGGEVVLTGGKAFSLAARLEATRLDVNRLLPPGEHVRGDSLVDGTVNLTAAFEPDQGRVDFGRSRLDLRLTKIGRDTLDRVLRLLDPTGSNPSIVGARSAVRLANPSSVRVTLFKGLVGLQILFQEGVLARFEMDRIPVSQIKQARELTETLPQWPAIRRAMEVLGAGRYGVDETGGLVLQ